MNESGFERNDALPIGTMLHGHEVVDVINSGAFGIAYKVVHLETGLLRVIKEYMPDSGWRMTDSLTIVPKSTSEQVLFDWGMQCFIDEAQLLMSLNHPNIVPVLEAFRKFGTAYFVMPFIEGQTLSDWAKENNSPTQEALEHIFLPLLEGLKYLHERSYLHRDIKPDNIIVAKNGNPILIDFGTAKQTTASKSQVLTKVLTPHFAALEQYSSKGPFTPALDLYGLAACMYYVISNQMPEEAPDRVRDDYYQSLQSMRLEQPYDSQFLKAIDKSLSLFAEDRFQTGMIFQQALMGMASAVEAENSRKTDDKAIKQLRALITFSGKDGVISLQEERGLLEEAQAVNVSDSVLWEEIRQQANDNGWIVESDGGDSTESSNLDLVVTPDYESMKRLYRVKGFRRFLFHLFGVIYILALVMIPLLAVMFTFSDELGFESFIELYSPEEGSVLFWLSEYVMPEGLVYFIVFSLQVIIPFWYVIMYSKIIKLKNRSQESLVEELSSIIRMAPQFLGLFYVSVFLMFNWSQFIPSLIVAALGIWSLTVIFSSFTKKELNESVGLK